MSQLDIKIRKLQDNGSTFRANIETLYLGGVRSAKVDELRFELPEEWKNCTVTLHVQRLSGTKPDPQILDENNSVLVDRRWTLEKEGTWMLLAINDSGYIAMTKPGKYTCYDTIDTDTTTENITPSIYEQFVAEVTKYAKQALESMNAAKTSETNAKTSETNAKASADKAKASADSMDASVATCTKKAKEAEASAVRAKTSETNAKTSETNAKTSENAAKTSETNAKASENAAKSSETKSAASEKAAKTSETAAKRALQDTETEHTAALQAIAQARTTALNDVANSTKTATIAANTATQQATAAAGSASAAATKAGEASTSRQAAEKAQKAAEDAAALAGTRAGTDKTLRVEDAPADAAATGEALDKKANKDIVLGPDGNAIFYSKAEVEAKIKEILTAQREEDLARIKFWASADPTSPASFIGGTWERIEDCTIWGASDTHPAGTKLEAGLPNITGNFDSRGNNATYYGVVGGSRGAFSTNKASGNKNGSYNVNSAKIVADDVTSFDASRSSSVYGNSDTVQPPAYCINIWRRVA